MPWKAVAWSRSRQTSCKLPSTSSSSRSTTALCCSTSASFKEQCCTTSDSSSTAGDTSTKDLYPKCIAGERCASRQPPLLFFYVLPPHHRGLGTLRHLLMPRPTPFMPLSYCTALPPLKRCFLKADNFCMPRSSC